MDPTRRRTLVTAKTPEQIKVRVLINDAEDALFDKIESYRMGVPLTPDETVELLESLGEADLAEKFGNWSEGVDNGE
jgi:hypothetical protein